MKNILFISPFAPYDKVPHAGGKIHNYYIKKFSKESELNVKLVTFASSDEKKNIDLDKYKIDNTIIYYSDGSVRKDIQRIILNFNSKLNPFHKNGGVCSGFIKFNVIKKLKNLKKEGYKPDVIVLEWTQIALLVEEVKNLFKEAKIISLEHDVSYLKYLRIFQSEKSITKRWFYNNRYKKLYSSELKALSQADLVYTLNYKDKNLILNSNCKVKKLDFICPYYYKFHSSKLEFKNKTIVFFGAMDRRENYESCIWFIKNVFLKLVKLDKDYMFYIVGSKPHNSLKRYKSNNIIITGFVNDIKPYFINSLCIVAPLVSGAGIKIKILEAMSAGCIVLTNEIGIEGIDAKDKKHYIHCEEPQEYYRAILDVSARKYNLDKISQQCRELMETNFNYATSYEKYKNELLN